MSIDPHAHLHLHQARLARIEQAAAHRHALPARSDHALRALVRRLATRVRSGLGATTVDDRPGTTPRSAATARQRPRHV